MKIFMNVKDREISMSPIGQVRRILEIGTEHFESETQTEGSDEPCGMSTYIAPVTTCWIHEVRMEWHGSSEN